MKLSESLFLVFGSRSFHPNIIASLSVYYLSFKRIKPDRFFIGLEDPDIFTDEKGIKHVYFTIAYRLKRKKGYEIFLGHARGKTLKNLQSKIPPLHPINKYIKGFKELTISPEKTKSRKE